jgi:hypothetical protein
MKERLYRMINTVDIKFIEMIGKNVLKELNGLSPTEANLIIPSDGFMRLGRTDWKVIQIVKEIDLINDLGEIHLTIHIYLNKITKNDYYLLK